MKHVTLMLLQKDGELLLARKRANLGKGKWNGAGGKLEPGETALQAAIRETQEEFGVTPLDARKVCEIDFLFSHDPDFHHYAHVFIATRWEGEPHETAEMGPLQWFPQESLPYDEMWGDDRYWLPEVLAGRRFRAAYTLDENDNITNSSITLLAETEEFTA